MARPWSTADVPRLDGRTAVVTGANSGIGLETARELARAGARVVLACRSPSKGRAALARLTKELPRARIELSTLDLADLSSIHAFADSLGRTTPTLDLLVNNAGIMMPPRGQTADGFETQFGTNHLGHFALTARLLPGLLRAAAARVVTVSSTAHRLGRIDFDNLNAEKGYSRQGAYAQSKLANLLFAYALERRFRAADCAASSLAAHPGWTATGLQVHSVLFRALNPLFSQAPPEGALPTLFAATSPGAEGGAYYGPSRRFETVGPPTRVRSSRASHDVEVGERLFELSEKLCGLRFEI